MTALQGGVRREWLVLSKRPTRSRRHQATQQCIHRWPPFGPVAKRSSAVLCPLGVERLPRREHALRLTVLHLAESAINYDAVHLVGIIRPMQSRSQNRMILQLALNINLICDVNVSCQL